MSFASVAVAGVGVGASIYKGLKSKSQDKAAAREGAALKRPSYQIPEEYFINRNIAAGQAQGGFSADEKTYMGEQRERALSSSLEALGETGGGPNDFAQLNKVFEDSLKSQAAEDAKLHMQNIQFFTNANKDLAGQKVTQWGVNELQPYESKLKEIQDRRIAAQTNQNNAFEEGLGFATAGATAYGSRNPPFGGKKTATDPTPYSRTFGLANTRGEVGSPAAGIPGINPNAPNILNVPAASASNGFPQFTPDEWGQMKQDAWDEGSNVSMWNQ